MQYALIDQTTSIVGKRKMLFLRSKVVLQCFYDNNTFRATEQRTKEENTHQSRNHIPQTVKPFLSFGIVCGPEQIAATTTQLQLKYLTV